MNLPVHIASILLGNAGEHAAQAAEHGAAAAGHGAAAAHGAHEAVQLVNQTANWLWLIPLFPLIGFTVNALAGHWLQKTFGKKVNHLIAIGAMVASWLVALFSFIGMVQVEPSQRLFHQVLWTLANPGGGFKVDFAFALDPLSMMMVMIITTIGTLIHVYSMGYMEDEKAYWRFFAYLNLFVFAMLLLVMGDGFAVMFFGWEGVGLASYLLIAFWYEDVEKAKAGMKAFVVNRIGDFGFLVGMFTLFWALSGTWGHVPGAYPTLNFAELREQFTTGGVGDGLKSIHVLGMPVLTLVGLGLFLGATGKSAQFPLYVWLPDAMAGPTPVSALIHAATMVTAGVYMIGRLNFVFALSPEVMTVIACVAAGTAFFAATIGFLQHDIKKVLAYSTVSQLGFMFIGVGVGAYWTGLYHLLTHAFFKATLFLGSGAVIYGCHHNQDMRKMGGLAKVMPITRWTYWYACVCITAAPIFIIGNGFFSKDEILWNAFRAGGNLLIPGQIIWAIGWISAMGTAFYMWRSYYMTFTGEYRGDLGHAHAVPAHAAAATHSVGAAHAATFDADILASANAAAVAQADDAHGHGGHAADDADDQDAHAHHGGPPKDAPKSMTYVLAALSVGSAVSILLGFWAPLGIVPALEHWLAPALPGQAITSARQATFGHWVEYLLIALSVGGALLGWTVARALYKDNKSKVPETMMKAWPRLHALVYDKYRVDEFYDATVLRLTRWTREAFSWFDKTIIDGAVNLVGWIGRVLASLEGAIDKHLVDGLVNLVGRGILEQGRQVRALETGRLSTYLYGILAGTLLLIGLTYLFGAGGEKTLSDALRAWFMSM
ncbi:MAG TPA: NADH-quinone oxidoreductase subunit L [Myxococcales bacterium]|jgi:NADH-quinone oxidoreductase subunit L